MWIWGFEEPPKLIILEFEYTKLLKRIQEFPTSFLEHNILVNPKISKIENVGNGFETLKLGKLLHRFSLVNGSWLKAHVSRLVVQGSWPRKKLALGPPGPGPRSIEP